MKMDAVANQGNKRGRKPIPAEKVKDIEERLLKQERPNDIKAETGIGLTKIYEIARALELRQSA